MKIAPWILILFLLQIGIMIFDNTYSSDSYYLNPYNQSSNSQWDTKGFWDFIISPTDANDNWFSAHVTELIAGAAGTLIVIGLYVFTKTETVLLVLPAGFFAIFGMFPIVNLYNIINREVSYYGACVTNSPCVPSLIISSIIVAPIVIYHIFNILEFWTGRQNS